MRLMMLLLPALVLVSAPAGQAQAEDAPEATLVFVVRHAEKAADDPRDPSLSPEGEARAQALDQLLAHAGVTHLLSSDYKRTRDTLLPLAERTGLDLVLADPRDAAGHATVIRGYPQGSVVVVAGHSNTVPALVRALGGTLDGTVDDPQHGEMLDDASYDRLFLLILGEPGQAQTVELRVGAP